MNIRNTRERNRTHVPTMKKSKFPNSEMAPAASAELFLPPEGPWWWVSMTTLSWCPLSSSLLSQISHEFIQSIYLQYWYAQINVIFSSSLGLALHLLGCSSLRLAIHKMKASRLKWRIERTFNDQHRLSNLWSKNITKDGNLQWNFSQRYMWICSKSALKPARQHLFPELAHIASKAHRPGEPWCWLFGKPWTYNYNRRDENPYGCMVNMRWRLHMVLSCCHSEMWVALSLFIK